MRMHQSTETGMLDPRCGLEQAHAEQCFQDTSSKISVCNQAGFRPTGIGTTTGMEEL